MRSSHKLEKRCQQVFLASLFLLAFLRLGLFSLERALANQVDAITDFPISSQVFDRNGELLYEFVGDVRRLPVPSEEIPTYLKQATIVAEDQYFFSHVGFDPIGIARAFLNNLGDAAQTQGASTLGQQLAKNTVLGRAHGYRAKLEEILLSVAIDARFSKDDIMDAYLNTIPYGSNIYGVEAASRFYFGKHVKDITIAEAATLAALPKHPTYLSPFGEHVPDLMARRDYILKNLFSQGTIDEKTYLEAVQETLALAKPEMPIKAPHFVMEVRNQLLAKYGQQTLENGGLLIRTTLDLHWQEKAEELMDAQAAQLDYNHANSAGLLAMNPRNGEILAMVGNRDYFNVEGAGNFNMTTALRQPGSSFKPLVYGALLDSKTVTPATILYDVPTNFGTAKEPYIPKDYDSRYRGPVTMRSALAQSLNIPAVRALTMVGIDQALDVAEDLGISTLGDRKRFGPSLVLGGGEVKLVELVGAYSAFANQGQSVIPHAVLEIDSFSGHKFTWNIGESHQVIKPETAFQISSILSDNIARSPIFGMRGSLTFLDRAVAVKTGTTQAYRDAWTVGYTPSIAVGVWVGNDDNKPLRAGAAGAMAAAPLWRAFMNTYLEGTPAEEFTMPSTVQLVSVPTVLGMKREFVAPWQSVTRRQPLVRRTLRWPR